jgi:DNA-binding transcriptional LysR family regulator
MLLAGFGFGFGSLPAHMIADDIAAGRLVRISPREWDGTADGPILPICAAWLAEARPGPVGRWLIAFFEQQATAEAA